MIRVRRAALGVGAALLIGAAPSLTAQTAAPSGRRSTAGAAMVPFQDAALTFNDLENIRGWYSAYDAALSATLDAGQWGLLASDQQGQANVIATKNELRELLSSVGDRRANRNVVLPILIRLRALFESVNREIYASGSPPAELNRMENQISGLLSRRLASQLDEYYRRFFIKYGSSSERLNWIEMILTEAMFTPTPVSQGVNMPTHWEWILREQIIGYQYESTLKSFRPSSPVSQLGLSYYLFGKGTVAKLLNHVGVAGAYQHDLTLGTDLYGAVLHVNRVDFGYFCERKCVKPVWATSLNVQLIRRVF
jgi:hypothetical protein